jgi:hypothetical protein
MTQVAHIIGINEDHTLCGRLGTISLFEDNSDCVECLRIALFAYKDLVRKLENEVESLEERINEE